jgi:hypothetical protein
LFSFSLCSLSRAVFCFFQLQIFNPFVLEFIQRITHCIQVTCSQWFSWKENIFLRIKLWKIQLMICKKIKFFAANFFQSICRDWNYHVIDMSSAAIVSSNFIKMMNLSRWKNDLHLHLSFHAAQEVSAL